MSTAERVWVVTHDSWKDGHCEVLTNEEAARGYRGDLRYTVVEYVRARPAENHPVVDAYLGKTQFYDRRTLFEVVRTVESRIRKAKSTRWNHDTPWSDDEVRGEVLEELDVLRDEFMAWLRASEQASEGT